MIATTTSDSQYATNYLKINQLVINSTYQNNENKRNQEEVQFSGDLVNLTYSLETVATYNSSLSLESNGQDGYNLLRGLVLNIFKEQGLDYKIETDNSEIDINTLTPEKAQELIADDGYFGVEKTG